MKIAQIEAVTANIRVRRLSTSYGKGAAGRIHAFVRVTTDDGLWGVGEAAPLPLFTGEMGETVAWVVNEMFGPALVGVDPFDVEHVHRLLDATLPRHTTSKHAVTTAIYDLLGKALGKPAGVLLGGRLADSFPIIAGIGIEDLDVTVATAAEAVAAGIGTLKMKIGVTPRWDVEAVAAVRAAVGDDVAIRVDANQRYTVKEAIQLVRALEPLNVQYVEQPVKAGDPRDLARVSEASSLPVAADESLYGPAEALQLLRARAADVFVIKLIKAGGMLRGRRVMAMAEAADIPCVVVSPYETSIGAAANLQVAASAPNVPFAIEVGGFEVPDDPARGVVVDGGVIRVPDGPGLGVEVVGLFENE